MASAQGYFYPGNIRLVFDETPVPKWLKSMKTHPASIQTKLSEESCFRSCFPKQQTESVLTTVFPGLPAIQHQSWEELLNLQDVPESHVDLPHCVGGGNSP